MINTTGGYYIIPSIGIGGAATILWSSGGTVTTVAAGSSYSLSAVTILNYSGGTVYSGVEQGQQITLNPAIVKGASGNTVAELAPDGIYVLGSGVDVNVLVQNSDVSFFTGYTENGTFIFPDSTGNTFNSFGELLTGFTMPAGSSAQTVIGDSLIQNSAGTYQVSVPATSGHTIPDTLLLNSTGGTVTLDALGTSLKAGVNNTIGNYILLNSESNILRSAPVPPDRQIYVEDFTVQNTTTGEEVSFLYSGSVYGAFSGSPVISNVFAQGGTLITSASTQAGGIFNTTFSDLVISNNSPLQLLSVSKALNNYFLPDIEWQNSNGADISSYLPVYYNEDMVAPDIEITNINGGQTFTVPLSGTVGLNFSSATSTSNIKVQNTAGTSLYSAPNFPCSSAATITISDSLFRLYSDPSRSIILSGESTPATVNALIDIPYFNIVNQDGQTATSVSWSGTVHTNFTGSTTATAGLIYDRPSWMGQKISYATGDIGYHLSSDTYNYQTTGSTVQKLDWDASDPFFTLSQSNEFDTYFRFTDDQGDEAEDGQFNFVDTWGSTRPSATPYYIIDHLTGLAWIQIKVGMSQNWATAMSTCHGYFYSGYTDFRMPSITEVTSVLRSGSVWHLGNNLFYRNIVFVSGSEIYMWLSDTDETISTGNAFRLQNGKDIVRAGKTSTSNYATYIVRTHY